MGRKIGNYRSTNKCSRLVTDNQRGLHLFCDIVFAVKARLSYLMFAFYVMLNFVATFYRKIIFTVGCQTCVVGTLIL